MGLSKTKTRQTNDPSAFAKPYVTAGADSLTSAFTASKPTLDAAQAQISGALPQLGQMAFGENRGLDAANDYNTSVLGGEYLREGNPYLGAVLDRTGADVRSRIQAQFSTAGRTGSGANQAAVARGLGDALGAIQYGDYNNERARMAQAASLAPTLGMARFAPAAAYLDLARSAAGLPMGAASQYAGGLGSLVGGYTTQTGTQSQSLGSVLGQLAGSGLSAWATGGFKGI